ncbi:MAG: hypothetical protein WD118_01280 [Phycisphaeraceae bacterium]
MTCFGWNLPVIVLALAGTAMADPIYTADNAPAAPQVGELEQSASITQYGITWTFDREMPVGQFVNGDYYVVGEVTITDIAPRPLLGEAVPEEELDARERDSDARQRDKRYVRNGSTLNPPAAKQVGYDSGNRNWYRPGLANELPIAMQPGDSLVSTISLKQGETIEFPYHGASRGRGHRDNSPLRTAAVLTCVAEPLPPDAFRPSWADHRASEAERVIYLARNLRRDLLPNLPRPTGDNIRVSSGDTDIDLWVRVFERPWINAGFFGFDQPMENMPQYGQWVGQAQSVAGLVLMLDFPAEQRERLLINVVQVGIDYWGAVRGGHPGWEGWGGHGSGRKFPIVFAGLMLGDDAMASPTVSYPNVNFGEDNQTMYGKTWTGAHVQFAGHSGVHSDGTIPRPHWGPYEHLHPSEWDGEGQRNSQSEAYRRANSSTSWIGQALVVRLLGAEAQWNHDAFFDYVDRWMMEDDTEHRRVIHEHLDWPTLVDDDRRYQIQGNTWEPFVKTMWEAHRHTLDAPTDGWKRPRDEHARPPSESR